MNQSHPTSPDAPPAAAVSRRERLQAYFDQAAPYRDMSIALHRYYHDEMVRNFRFFIPPGASVLEVGCGTGQLLDALQPRRGVGIDLSPRMIQLAREKFPGHEFHLADAESCALDEQFDYIVLSDLIGFLHDVQHSLENVRRMCHARTRVVLSHYNFLWEPALRVAEWFGMKAREPVQNWLGSADVDNLLRLAGFEVVRATSRVLLPSGLPGLAPLCNRILVNLPGLRHLGMVQFLVARPRPDPTVTPLTVSVVIPCRNERDNVAPAVARTPDMGAGTEIIFVEGGSSDGTADEIQRVMAANPGRRIRHLTQTGKGKGDAVRAGFAAAEGEVLMILDADLTVEPEELPKFYEVLASGQGEFVFGTRLVYPMERQAMRFLNMLANKFFSLAFSYLLEQRFKDTLCGTKVLRRGDYDRVARGRAYFGEFDPFGDFDLIFGAAKLNLKMVEVPIHYRDRTYGTTNISRFRHGWLLLRMTWFALWKLKFA